MAWCLLDMDYLCYRAWYAMGELQIGDVFTGVTFGVLRDIISIQDRFMPSRIIFCFDHGKGIRKEIFPGYKQKRLMHQTDFDKESKKHFDQQRTDLKTKYLTDLGYKNVFFHYGYEADDVIARVIQDYPEKKHIIISSDHDLYQLLSPTVSMYNPRSQEITTYKEFCKEWGVEPTQWVDVKAIAGCVSDSIPGVKGVGELSAAKFISGRLDPSSAMYRKVVAGNDIWKENIQLVKLPLDGIKGFEVKESDVLAQEWEALAERLGFKSLRGAAPIRRKGGEKEKREKGRIRG